jgi:hypothetical protein
MRRPSRALRYRGEEAFIAREPLVAESFMTAPSASGDPGVVACPAHDLPGADGDAVVGTVAVRVVPDVDPLGSLSKHKGSVLSGEGPGWVDADLLYAGMSCEAEEPFASYKARERSGQGDAPHCAQRVGARLDPGSPTRP